MSPSAMGSPSPCPQKVPGHPTVHLFAVGLRVSMRFAGDFIEARPIRVSQHGVERLRVAPGPPRSANGKNVIAIALKHHERPRRDETRDLEPFHGSKPSGKLRAGAVRACVL